MNLSKIEAEIIIQILTGGDTPSDGDTIVRGLDGWHFSDVLGQASGRWVSIDADGAVGDGVEDDTELLQSVLDRAQFILFPADKTFKITETLLVYAGQVIIGAGETSIIEGELDIALISSDDPMSGRNRTILANFVVNNVSSGNVGGIGIDGTNINEFLLINILCTNVETGYKLDGDATLINCVGLECDLHFDCNGGHLKFIGPRAENAPTSGTGFDIDAGVETCVIIAPELIELTTEYGNAGSVVVIKKDNIQVWADEPIVDLFSNDASGKRWKWVSGGGNVHTAGDAILHNETDGRQPLRVKGDALDELLVLDDDGIEIGAGNAIKKHLTAVGSLNFGSIAAQTTAELNVTLSGLVAGDACEAVPDGSPESGLIWSCYATTDAVVVRLANVTTGAIDPAARDWRVSAWKH